MKTKNKERANIALSAPSNKKEVWKDIPGYEGSYQVSNFGRVKSLERTVDFGEQSRVVNECILKQRKHNKTNYRVVAFWDKKLNCSSTKRVHQLVLQAFVGLPPDNCEVLHINGNPSDNRLSNLRYGTRSENSIDRYRHAQRGLVLSQSQVKEIRELLKKGVTQKEISKIYGCSQTNISRIKRGVLFKWVV